MKKISDLIDTELHSSFNSKSRHRYNSKHTESNELFNFLDLISRWHEVVGERLSKVTVPLKLHKSTLSLLTNHSAYSQQLSLLEDTLKQKIYMIFPSLKGHLKKLRFVVSTQHFEEQKEELLNRCNSKLSHKNIQKSSSRLHKKSPHYIKLKQEAEKEFKSVLNSAESHQSDQEFEKVLEKKLVSLYIQSREKEIN